MTNTPGVQATPPGWYPDPQGGPVVRWWDGSQWTQHAQNQYVASPVLKAPEGTAPYTPFIWILALLPILELVLFLTFDWSGYIRRSVDSSLHASINGSYSGMLSGQLSFLTPGYLMVVLGGWGLYGLSAFFAFLDWRALRKRGVPKPFHFAFTFISPGVYVIGRSVVARRRIGRGIAPMWVWIGLTVAITIILLVVIFAAIFSVAGELSQYDFSTNG